MAIQGRSQIFNEGTKRKHGESLPSLTGLRHVLDPVCPALNAGLISVVLADESSGGGQGGQA
jgi:hypothetical protein